MTLMIYSFFIFGPMQEMGNVIAIYREAEASINNFQSLMDTPAEQSPEQPAATGTIKRMQFDEVTFRHPTATQPAVDGISFEVANGETIAFVGPSGSGKTTLVKLLIGLYQPQTGNILYNSVKHHQVSRQELQEQIGFVAQDTQLFSGTIRENLLFEIGRAHV